MKKIFYLVIFALFSCSKTENDIKTSDLQTLNLFGKVKELKQVSYRCKKENGKIVKINREWLRTISGDVIIYFDSTGNKLKTAKIDKNNKLKYFETFSYDNQQKLIRKILFSKDSTLLLSYRFEYNERGNLIKEECFDFENVLVGYYIYEYDHNNLLVKLVMYDSNLEWIKEGDIGLSETLSYEYDNKGNRVSEKIFSSHENILLEEKVSRFDKHGNIIHQESFKNNYKMYRECNYDKQGNLTKEQIYNSDKSVMREWNYEYSFDEKGNWMSKLFKFYDSPEFIVVRQISYY